MFYGFLVLFTEDVASAMLAHSLANLAAALLWLRENGEWDKEM